MIFVLTLSQTSTSPQLTDQLNLKYEQKRSINKKTSNHKEEKQSNKTLNKVWYSLKMLPLTFVQGQLNRLIVACGAPTREAPNILR